MLRTAVTSFGTADSQLRGDPSIRSSITLRPAGPLGIDRGTGTNPRGLARNSGVPAVG